MKYYLTNYVLKRSITGTDRQTNPAPYNGGKEWWEAPNSVTKIKRQEFPDFIPNAHFELETRGKYSDIVMIHNTDTKGFLISPRVKELWSKFKVFSCQYYPAILTTEMGEVRDYFLFHMAAKELEGIDYNKSEFNDGFQILEEHDDGRQIFAKIKLSKLEDRQLKTDPPRYVDLHKIYFNQDFPDYDLFYLPYFQNGATFFISQRLVDAMNKEKITGLAYHEQNIIDEF
jgi:hypothetical protein